MTIDSRIRAWLEKQIGNVTHAEKLLGSTSSTLYRISTENERYVLRLFDNEEWVTDEPDLCEHEAAALNAASGARIKTPKLIAYEPDASVVGVGLLLMEHLVGEVWLHPDDMDDWLRQVAETLAAIHTIKAPNFAWQHFRYTAIETLKLPSWSQFPERWQVIIDILHSPEPVSPQVFIHRDYHMTNFLWQDGKLSGVVDWINACIGVAGLDVGHMRFNLSQLYGVDIADQFLLAYQAANPNFEYLPYWDIVSVGDTFLYEDKPPFIYQPWVEFGMQGLTEALLLERAEAYIASLLNRI